MAETVTPTPEEQIPAEAAEEQASEEAEDKPWATYVFDGREITFRRPSAEQLMVMRRITRDLSGAQGDMRTVRGMEKILNAVSALMMTDDDRDHADSAVLELRVGIDELIGMTVAAIVGPYTKKAEEAKPQKRVRRGR